MTIKNYIVDGTGTGDRVKVTSRGQLIVAPIEFSSAYQQTVDATGTAFNFVPPINGKRFVLTDIIIEAAKSVSTTVAATVELYEATSATSIVINRAILNFDMVRYAVRSLNGLNLICSEGRWINIQTDDATLNATIMGYYVDA